MCFVHCIVVQCTNSFCIKAKLLNSVPRIFERNYIFSIFSEVHHIKKKNRTERLRLLMHTPLKINPSRLKSLDARIELADKAVL